jgi:hypothetical protein
MSSSFTIGEIASVVGIAGGINSLMNSGGGGSAPSPQQAQKNVDPFAAHRGEFGDMYASAMKSGGNIDPTSMPGYSQWMSGVLNPAMEASQRKAAATGQGTSGGEQAALQTVGQQGYYSFMTDYLNRLAQGSGATASPAAGGQAANTQAGNNQAQFYSGLGAVTQGMSGLSGYFGTGVDATPTDMSGFYSPAPPAYANYPQADITYGSGASAYTTSPMPAGSGLTWSGDF